MSDPSLTNEPVKALDPVPGDGHEPGPALVRIERLTKSFGSKIALKDVTFSVPAGQICGLLGPNGAGKTTLFRLLMGILKATSGQVCVDNLDAFEERVSVKRLIGFLPDEPIFYSYLSGRDSHHLSATDVSLAINQQNLILPAGTARLGDKEFVVRMNS